jgi:hypothetical protein
MDGRSEFEDLAFSSRSSRESDEVGSEDMCEHGMNSQAVMMIADRHLVVVSNKRAEFRRTEKVGEGMALKIWAELKHPSRFILIH